MQEQEPYIRHTHLTLHSIGAWGGKKSIGTTKLFLSLQITMNLSFPPTFLFSVSRLFPCSNSRRQIHVDLHAYDSSFRNPL